MKRSVLLIAMALVAMTACGEDDDDATATPASDVVSEGSIVVYSGRSEELVGPLIDMFEAATGITAEVRYGDTAEMASTILEEGDNSPADVFFSQDAGALGALSSEGRLVGLDPTLVDRVDPAWRSPEGEWVGVSGRARVVVYNTDTLTEDDLPDSILEFTAPEWEGRIGWAPTNGSFQAFVTGLRLLEGEDGAREWLEGIQANGAQVYEGNVPIVEAVAAGEIDVGFVNHYYVYELKSENPALAAANKLLPGGDPGALVNVAGAGVLASSEEQALATRFVEYLLSEEAQSYFASVTYELPLVKGVEPDPSLDLPDIDSLTTPDLELSRLEDLEGTLELLMDTGVL